jgi:hypothetical protein
MKELFFDSNQSHEDEDLQMMMSCPSQELVDLWDNDKDALYDEEPGNQENSS